MSRRRHGPDKLQFTSARTQRQGAHGLIGIREDSTALEELADVVSVKLFPVMRQSKGGLDKEGDCEPLCWLWCIGGHRRMEQVRITVPQQSDTACP